jgi:hypothetical protein
MTTTKIKRTTTVTHPDGTASKRTSQRAEYRFAVVVETDQRHEAEALRSFAEGRAAEAWSMLRAAETLPIDEIVTPLVGRPYHRFHIGGHYAGAYHEGSQVRPTPEEIRHRLMDDAERLRQYATTLREQADALDAGPEITYSVYRWSRSADLAEKGRLEIVDSLGGRSRAYVVPVDEEAPREIR